MTGSHRRPPWAREETAKEQEVQKLKWPGDREREFQDHGNNPKC